MQCSPVKTIWGDLFLLCQLVRTYGWIHGQNGFFMSCQPTESWPSQTQPWSKKVFVQTHKFRSIDGDTLNGAPAVLSRLFKDSLKNWAGNLRTTHLSSTGQAFFNFPWPKEAKVSKRVGKVRATVAVSIIPTAAMTFPTQYFLKSVWWSPITSYRHPWHGQWIVPYLMEGSLFDGPRKYKAGLAKSDSCPKCGCQNTHIHMFRDCPFSEKPSCFGGIRESSLKMNPWIDFGPNKGQSLKTCPTSQYVGPGCFHWWQLFSKRRFSRAARGMYAPRHGKLSVPLPDLDIPRPFISKSRDCSFVVCWFKKKNRGPLHIFFRLHHPG